MFARFDPAVVKYPGGGAAAEESGRRPIGPLHMCAEKVLVKIPVAVAATAPVPVAVAVAVPVTAPIVPLPAMPVPA